MLQFAHQYSLAGSGAAAMQITQYKINWISVQNVVKFICLLQVGAISLQYSHDDVIG